MADETRGNVQLDQIQEPVVEDSLRQFDMAQKSQYEVRMKCLQDRRFVWVDGAQWEDALRLQFDNKPRFEINKLHLACVRIFNEYRNNRIAADFRPSDEDADEHTADFLNGLYRAGDAKGGQEAKDNAFEEGVAGGMGAWRLTTKYADDEDEDNETQIIVREPIYDADRFVFFNLGGKTYNKHDADRCWVLNALGRAEYSEQYGESPNDPFNLAAKYTSSAQSMGLGRLVTMTEFDWYTPDVVYIVEYYKREEVKEKIHVFRALGQNGKDMKVKDGELKGEEGEKYRADLEAQGYTHVRSRTIKKKRVRKWIHDGARILEDCGYIAGPNIPIVPFYGKRALIDNQERIQGHIRTGKDSQRLLNMQTSLLAIISALSPRQKPVFTPEEILGHEMTWADDNIDDKPYLLRNAFPQEDGSMQPLPLTFTQPPTVPPALAAMIELTNADIKELLGEQEAGEQMVSNVSAKAVELVQNHVDMLAYGYLDNMAKSVQRDAEIWLGMAKEIYDEEGRPMTLVGPDGKRSTGKLKEKHMVDGEVKTINDPSKGKFECITDVGPAFRSRRDATVRALVGMLQFIQDPQIAQIVSSLILTNMDGEGLEDLREFMRIRLVNEGVLKPTPDEAKQIKAQQEAAAQQPPSPQDQLMAAQMKHVMAEIERVMAETAQKKANTVKTLADSANSRADAIANLASVKLDHLKVAHEVLQTLIAQTGEDAQAAGNVGPGSSQAAQVAQAPT